VDKIPDDPLLLEYIAINSNSIWVDHLVALREEA
jgi:hypothetical protein